MGAFEITPKSTDYPNIYLVVTLKNIQKGLNVGRWTLEHDEM